MKPASLWYLLWSDNAKLQYCPRRLVEGLTHDMEKRNHPIFKVDRVDVGLIDRPGMILANRTVETIRVDTFELNIPAEDYGYFFKELQMAPVRTMHDGEKYHKIHGWIHCILFTPEQRSMVLDVMEKQLRRVERVAEEERERFIAGIRAINRDGVKVITSKDPESLKELTERLPLSGKPNDDVN